MASSLENIPDKVYSGLAESYNTPGSTGHFRNQFRQQNPSVPTYNDSPLFTQEQITAGQTSQHLTNSEYYETLASSVKTDYNPTSGEVIFQAPKSIAETRQWKDFVTSINNTFRGQPLEQAINYMDTDEYKEAAATALSNAVTSVMQRDSLNASLGQEINQQETDIFGASSTLSDGSGGIRGGAYMYVPEVQSDGTVKYVQKSADEALKAKNIANILPGFIYNQKEYIDSTQGEYTATGTAVGLAAGSKLGPIGALVGAGIGGTAGFLMGDSEGKMDNRFAEVQKIVNEKGDTSLMDLSQDEKAEVYAAVSEAVGRLQSWADKGIALSDDMKQYYVNLVGLQSSLDDLGFSHMSDLTNAKNWVENFVRQRANNLFGGSTLLSLVGGVEGAASGRGFGNGFLETQEALTTTGLDTYASPAEQLFAKRNEDGTIGDTGFLGLAADVGLGLLLDPAGSVASKTAQWANNGLRRTVNGIASVIDDGGISILAAGMGKVGRGIGGKIRSAAGSRLGEEAVSGASAGAHSTIKKVAREVAEGAETQVDEGLDKAIDSMADSISDSGSDAVKRTISDAAQEGEEQLAGDLENIGKNMTKEEIERAAGEATTDGINLSDKLQTFARRVFDGAVDNIAKGIVKTYDALTVSGNLGKISELVSQLTGKGAKELSQETRDQLISQYRRLVARGAVADAVRQIARQMPLNAVVALGNTAIEAQTARSLGQDYDKDEYLDALLGNFGMAMLTSAAPAGLRTGSRLLDAMTGGGVTKLKQKASQFAAKIATIPPTIARNAPGISTLRQKMQKLANPNAKQLNELRYQNHRAFAQGDIDYDTWMNNQALLSDAQFSTSTLNLIRDLDAKGLFTADRDVMNMLGGVTKSGRPKVLGGNYDRARQLVNDFINYDNMARRLKHPRNPDESKDTALSKKRKAKSDEYIKIRDEALDEMHRIIEENGGDIDEFDRALFGTSLDAEVDTSAGPIRADANDQSLMGRLRHFYDVRSQMMADEGLTSQTALDALRTNPSYAGTYIRFAYSDGASVDEIAENLAQFYTVTAKPKTSKLVQTVKDELGMAEGKTAAGPVETAVMSINDVSDAILANQRNRVAVQLSDALGDSDLDFCRQATDPDVVVQGEQEINEYTEFRQRAGDAFADVITVTEYETTGEEGGPRTDRDTNNLNEYHTRLTNDPYIQKRAQETGIPPEALARSYMADNVSSMVGTYRKQEMHRYGDKKAKQLAGAYRKKVNSWLSGEDLTQADLHTRRQANVEMNDTRQRLRNVSDEVLRADIANKSTSPVDKMLAQQELARRQSTSYEESQLSDEWSGTSQELIDDSAKAIYSAAKTVGSQETLDSVNPTGSVSVDYTPEKRATASLGKNITTLAETAGKSPSDTITIYRGVPKDVNEIVAGDFVTTNKQLAQDYAGDGNVISLEVTYGDILDDRTEPLGEEYIYRPSSPGGEQTSLLSDPRLLPEGYQDWHDTFVRENGTEPTVDDISQQMLMEAQGKRKVQLTTASLRSTYRDVLTRENNSGVVTDEYLAEHKRKLHLGKQVDEAKAKKAMSFIPKNGIELAENKDSAPNLAQVKSAAIYTGQTGKPALSSDVVQALERRGVKQTATSQARAINSIAAEDAIVDTDGSFYSELNKTNQKTYLDNLQKRTKAAVESVGGKFEIPEGMEGQELAGYLGKQLQRARLAQEISTNPERYSKGEYSVARDEKGNKIPGSGKYLTSPERLVVKSVPTSKFDGFNKFNQGLYKTKDQRNAKFSDTDDVWLGSAQVLAGDDRAALEHISKSMKRFFASDPLMRDQINAFTDRISSFNANSLDDLPLVQELLNSVYGVDAVRFTKQNGDDVLLFSNTKNAEGGVWDTQTKFGTLTPEDLHAFDTTADLWKENVKSKQSDTKQRIAEEKKAEKEAQRKPNFTVYEKGKKYVYEITNPTVAQTFQTVSLSTSKTAFDIIGKFFQRTQRLFRVMTTGSGNPAYLMTNYVRDLQTSAITGGMNAILPQFSDDIYSSIFETVGIPTADADAIASRLRNGYSGSAYNLSQSQSILRRSPQEQRKILTKTARQIAGVKSTRIPSSFEEVVDLAGKPSDAIENKRRGKLADNYYNQYIMNHMPEYLANPTEANRKKLISNATNYGIFYARNATTDFSYQPQYASQFLSFIPYARTGMASARSFGRTFLADPIGMLSRIICLGIGPYTANLVCNLSDPDKAAIYSEIPEYERADNWIIVRNDGTYISIPLPQELIPFLAPSRVLVENSKDVRNSGAFMSIASGLCNYSPIDFSGFFERDINGDIDFVKGVSRVANSVMPQALSPAVEQILNRDLYTGSPLNPTVEDLVRQGAKLNKDGTIDASEMTYASRNSQTLGEIANFLNMPQGAVYNYVTNYLGTASKYVINAVDTLRGAPSDARGGQGVGEYTSQLFFNSSPGGASSAWNNGISKLYDQKDLLMETIDSDTSQEEKDEIVKDFTDSVVRFCDAYSDYYSLAGGMTDKQRNQVVGLLNFYQGSNTLQTSDEALQNASYDEYNAAMQRAVDAGIIPKEGLKSQLYGKMNDEGEVTFSTPAMRALTTKVYGTPEEAVYQMEQVLDSSEGGGTMKDLKSAVYDALDPYYDRIAAGEQLTDDEYNEMDAIRKAYMDEFYRRIDPIIEQYGATILNNDDIIEALNDYTITTSDDWQESIPQYSKKGKEYHRYISSKLFPNATADVQQILLEHYGMGGRDTGNLQTDKRADDLIRTLQEATANGEMGKAQDYQRLLFTGIQNGSLYVSDQDMSQLGI